MWSGAWLLLHLPGGGGPIICMYGRKKKGSPVLMSLSPPPPPNTTIEKFGLVAIWFVCVDGDDFFLYMPPPNLTPFTIYIYPPKLGALSQRKGKSQFFGSNPYSYFVRLSNCALKHAGEMHWNVGYFENFSQIAIWE